MLPGVAELREQFRTFRYSAFRLETLQAYAGSDEDPARLAFQRGDPTPPPDPHQDQWLAMLRAHRDAGRTQQRVHIVREPLSDYLAFELTWEYGPHVAAGEDIRIIPVTDTWPLDVPDKDFWLFDSQQLFDLNYDADGNWLGVQHNTDPAAVARAGFVRDAALHQSTSWADYMATKSALLQRLPKGK
jgi:hypothetical protein